MARIQIASEGWGWLADVNGTAQPNRLVTLNGTVYDSQTSGSPIVSVVTDANGRIPGYIEEGSYTLVAAGVTQTVEAVSGSTVNAQAVNVEKYIPTAVSTSAAIQSAITDATNAGTTEGRVTFKPGKTYILNAGSTPTIPPNLPGKGLIVEWRGATIQLTTTVPRFLDLGRTAPNQTFNYELIGGTVDANWVGGQHHIVCGTYQTGSTASGLDTNLGTIAHRGIKVVNALTDANTATNHRRGFLYYLTLSANAPRSGKVLFEDCEVEGGNAGFEVMGGSSSNVDIVLDALSFVRCRSRLRAPLVTATLTGAVTLSGTPQSVPLTGVVGSLPTSGTVVIGGTLGGTATAAYTSVTGSTLNGVTLVSGTAAQSAGVRVTQHGANAPFGPQAAPFGSANFQVGSYAKVRHFRMEDCEGYYSGDVGLEADNVEKGEVVDSRMEDAYGANWYYTNFSDTTNPLVAGITYDRCESNKVLQTYNALISDGWKVDTHNSITINRYELSGCVYKNAAGIAVAGGAMVNATGGAGGFNYITIENSRAVVTNLSTSATTTMSALALNATGTRPVVKVRNFDYRLSGAGSGSFVAEGIFVSFGASGGIFDGDNITVDLNVTGIQGGGLRAIEVNAGTGVRFKVRRLKPTFTGDTAPRGLLIRGTSTLTVTRGDIEGCDFSGMAAGSNEVLFTDNTNKPFVHIAPNNVWRTTLPSTLVPLVIGDLTLNDYFGATGNGTTLDTTAFQAAIDAVSTAGGGKIKGVPGSTYYVGQITPKSNVILELYGCTMKLDASATQAMFYWNSGTLQKFKIRGGTFTGTGVETTAQAILQINTPGISQDVEVRDTTVTSWATGPFYFGNALRAKAINNTMTNVCIETGTNAINFVSQLASGTVQSCIATDNIITGCKAHAIAYVNTGTTTNTECRVVICDNTIECTASNTGTGIDLEFSVASIGEGSKFTIDNNICTYNGVATSGYALSVNGASGTDASMLNRVVVTGNVVDSTASGILLMASQASCTGNVINCGQAAIFAGKGASNPTQYNTIANNVCHATTAITAQAVINVSFLQHSKVTGNIILVDAGAASSTPNGIAVASSGWIDLLDNEIINAPRHGILVAGNDFDIRGNRIYNPSAQAAGFQGVFLNTATGVVRVIDNTIIDDRGTHQMTNGVNVTSTAQAEVTGNYISGYLTAAVSGTVAFRSNNRLTGGNASGRATLVSGTVTVSTAEIQTSDNVILSVVVPGGTRGEIQLGTIVAGTSFVINSIQPGTASTVQTLDTSTIFWKIEH